MPQHYLPSPALLPMVSLVCSTMHLGMLKLGRVCLHPSCSSLQHSFAECLQGAGMPQGLPWSGHWAQVFPSAAGVDEAPQAVLSQLKIQFLILSEPNILKLGTCSYFGKARLAGPYRMLSGGAQPDGKQ